MTNLDYGMYSKAGNQRIASIITGALKLPIATTNAQLYSYLKARMSKVAEKYPEVWDSDVRSALISVLERKLHRELSMYF